MISCNAVTGLVFDQEPPRLFESPPSTFAGTSSFIDALYQRDAESLLFNGDRAMMNGGWGWGMGGFGGVGILAILVVVGIAVLVLRRSNS
jgi:hypothetical protein